MKEPYLFKPGPKPKRGKKKAPILCLDLPEPLWSDLYAYLLHVRRVYPKTTRQAIIRQMISYCLDQVSESD